MNQETVGKRKKVLFVITKSNFGGAQRYVFDLATNLPKSEFEVVVAAGTAQGTGVAGELLSRLGQAGIRTIFVPEMRRDIAFLDIAAFRALVRILRSERPDVVHLNSSKAGGLGGLAARLAGTRRIVFTVHGWAFREARNPLSRLLIYIASMLTVLVSHRVICISQRDMQAFAKLPALASKFSLVHTGIHTDATPLGRDAARKELSPGHERDIWIGSIGEMTHNKNMKMAVDALSLARKSDQRLYLVAIGDGEQRGQLVSYVHRKGLEGHAHFSGHIAHASRYMAAFDIFLLPSRKEGLPYVLLEAALARVPVVASDVGGIPELVDNGVSGALCDPSDTMGFADALVELAADANLRDRFAGALYEKVVSQHSLEKMVAATATLYR